jgi:hypothetical protein
MHVLIFQKVSFIPQNVYLSTPFTLQSEGANGDKQEGEEEVEEYR